MSAEIRIRIFPPPAGFQNNPLALSDGTVLSAAPGGYLDVVERHAHDALNNGWTSLGRATVGATSERPTSSPGDSRTPARGALHIDTTLAAVVVWDGSAWRSCLTGEAV